MSTPFKKQAIADQSSETDERRWRAWVARSRELDRLGGAKRLQFIVMSLAVGGVTVAAATLYKYLR